MAISYDRIFFTTTGAALVLAGLFGEKFLDVPGPLAIVVGLVGTGLLINTSLNR